jgi:hypothetical protein
MQPQPADVSPPVRIGGILPAHEWDIPLAVDFVQVAKTYAIGKKTSLGAVLKNRAWIQPYNFAGKNVQFYFTYRRAVFRISSAVKNPVNVASLPNRNRIGRVGD